MAERNRQENRDQSGSDQSLELLIHEYMASTREPVGSRNLFRETADQSDRAEPRARAHARARGRDEVVPAEPSAIILYVICVTLTLIVALALGFL